MSGILGAEEKSKSIKTVWADQSPIQTTEVVKAGEGELQAGAVLAEAFDGGLYALAAASAVAGEVVGAGDGTTTQFSATLANRPIIPGTVTVTAPIGGAGSTLTEDGRGNLVGADGSGVITYGDDGEAQISLTFTTAPDNGADITVDYEHGSPTLKHDPIGVLLHDVDATSADVEAEVARGGAVRLDALVWPAGISDANKTWALAQLAKRGVHAV